MASSVKLGSDGNRRLSRGFVETIKRDNEDEADESAQNHSPGCIDLPHVPFSSACCLCDGRLFPPMKPWRSRGHDGIWGCAA